MKYGLVLLLLTTMLLAACAQDIGDNVTFCPAIYDPVCGNDGVTYGNSCEAERAGITSYVPGECGTSNGEPIDVCPAIYDPVCGQPPMPECPPGMACPQVMPDPKTYGNDCEMTKAGATLIYEGECDANLPAGDLVFCTPEQLAAQMCTREYMPVCGDDGITYGNKCEACAGDATAYTPGECEPQEFNCTEEEKAATVCTMEYAPVCGDDGVTYGNKCSACVAQVDSYTQGECA